jgi:biotin synthase
MGAAWRGPKDKRPRCGGDMIAAVKALGLETCVTLGMLKEGQAEKLKAGGLDYYNHNLDTAPEFYGEVVSTRSQRRPLRHAGPCATPASTSAAAASSAWARRAARAPADRRAGQPDAAARIGADQPLVQWSRARRWRSAPSRSIRSSSCAPSPWRASRCRRATCACRRAARSMSDEMQALCFLAGANSIFYGDKLLTTGNPEAGRDEALFKRLGLHAA